MSDGPIQAIVFDIGRVLVGIDIPRGVRRLAQAAGVGEFEAEFALFGPHYREFARGRLGPAGFHEAVCRAIGAPMGYEQFREAWCDMFAEMPQMEPLVAALSHSYPLYLCSNTDPLHYAHVREQSPILGYARGAVLSYEVGHEKPAPEIYRELLARFGLSAQATLFIDDREENVAGALALGLSGLVFEGAEELRADLVEMGLLRD
jgi:HAD superfamily hydrolase (TIGR01509 family)